MKRETSNKDNMDTKMMVQVSSTTTIKPSIPTPQRNRPNLKLSLLDQIYPPVYNSCVIFYTITSSSPDTSSLSNTLRKSLSETLVDLYPFAGRVRENSYIDCGDQGACFVEAQADCELSDFFRKPDLDSLRQFVPVPLLNDSGKHHHKAQACNADNGHGDPILLVQLTSFACGGIAIGVSILHKIGDGMSLISFLKSWSSVTRGNQVIVSPQDFIGASLLPPVDSPPLMKGGTNVDYPGWAPRRFVFHTSKLASLRAELTNIVEFKPTDTELVAAILFRRIIQASETFQPSTLEMAVNLRPKLAPPLPENTIGNLVMGVLVSAEKREDTRELREFVRKIRKGLVEFYNEKASGFKGEDKLGMVCSLFKEKAECRKRGVRVYTFSSVCKFPFYETDFGWGKPAWMTCPMLFPMYLIFMDTKSGDGIEVWATLKDEVMAVLEHDEELLAFASLNPSISDKLYSRM